MILATQVPETLERFAPLAKHLARRWTGSATPLEVRVDATSRGLLAAADEADPAAPGFTVVAVRAMVGELRAHAGRSAPAPADPPDCARLRERLGREPTACELARWAAVDVEDVVEAHAR